MVDLRPCISAMFLIIKIMISARGYPMGNGVSRSNSRSRMDLLKVPPGIISGLRRVTWRGWFMQWEHRGLTAASNISSATRRPDGWPSITIPTMKRTWKRRLNSTSPASHGERSTWFAGCCGRTTRFLPMESPATMIAEKCLPGRC